MYNTRQYIIFPTTELSKVDFTQVLETSEETVRKSVDNSKTFVKWSDEQPLFISNLVGSEGPYTHEEIIEILSTEEWTPSIEEII
jgi:hypothetical protein